MTIKLMKKLMPSKLVQGDLVQYKEFPHKELRESGMTGIVLTKPYRGHTLWENDEAATMVDVLWDRPRSPAWGEQHISEEYIDEIEVVT